MCFLPLRSSIRAGMMPDLANMAAQESSMDTVPISITTSRIRSSSAEPKTHRGQRSKVRPGDLGEPVNCSNMPITLIQQLTRTYTHTQGQEVSVTRFEALFEVRDEVVFAEQQLPVQVRDGEVRQRAQTLDHKLLVFFRADLSCQITHIILQQRKRTQIHDHAVL